jgi:hypothetical protein
MNYTPQFNAKQEIALDHLSHRSQVEQVLFGGGVYGGKSWLGCYWQIARRLKYPNTRGLIGRSALKNLELSTMLTFWKLCQDMGMKAGKDYQYNGQLNIIRWFNGSETILMDMADKPSDPQFTRLGSHELTDYFIDEAGEVSEGSIDILDSRTRYNLIGGVPKGLLTCNPHKGWLYRNFYDPARKEHLPDHRAFVESLLKDNTIKPNEAYEAKMMRMPEEIRKRLLEGDWDYDESKDTLFSFDDTRRIFSLEPESQGKMYVSADIAAMGDDKTIVGVWRGLSLIHIYEFVHKYPHEIAKELRDICSRHGVPLSQCIVDADGLGIGVQGILRCVQFNNGARAVDSEHYVNLRSECYYKLSEVMSYGKIACSTLKYEDEIVRQLDAVRRKDIDKERKLAVSTREEIVKRLGYSPDIASMMMMRMHFELKPTLGKYAFGSIG